MRGVKLTFNQAADSQVTDTMLAKGPTSLTNNEVILWLDDIKSKKYTIIRLDHQTNPTQDKPETPDPDFENIEENANITALDNAEENQNITE